MVQDRKLLDAIEFPDCQTSLDKVPWGRLFTQRGGNRVRGQRSCGAETCLENSLSASNSIQTCAEKYKYRSVCLHLSVHLIIYLKESLLLLLPGSREQFLILESCLLQLGEDYFRDSLPGDPFEFWVIFFAPLCVGWWSWDQRMLLGTAEIHPCSFKCLHCGQGTEFPFLRCDE